jgi:endoglucanase
MPKNTAISTQIPLLLCSFLLISCPESESSAQNNETYSSFWDGKNMLLRGMAFGNGVWYLAEPDPTLHNEEDYKEMQRLGLNAVRFYLSYKYFEDDNAPYQYKQSGFDWLNQNIEWARANGIKLFLNIHVPQGGFQSNGEGGALWENAENQNRLTALWRKLASVYANDTAIAAYDLLNEPVTTKNKEQWQTLAQRLADTIRTIDSKHFLLVERLNGLTNGDYSQDSEMNFVFINDPANKWGLTFHFYSPIEYTHQYASWVDAFKNTDGGKYPDASKLAMDEPEWKSASFDNPAVSQGTSDWEFYEGKWKTASDTSASNIARPTLMCQNAQSGTAWFNNLIVEEKSPSGEIQKIASYENLPGIDGWYFWTEKPGGSVLKENGAVGITGTVSDANYASKDMYFLLKQGYSYRASGKMKGYDIPSSAACRIRIDFAYTKSISARDYSYLEKEVDKYAEIASKHNLPVFLGEFGVIKHTFEGDKGGLKWVEDMVSILRSQGISFTYHAWYDDSFGVRNNAALKDVFGRKFRSRAAIGQ